MLSINQSCYGLRILSSSECESQTNHLFVKSQREATCDVALWCRYTSHDYYERIKSAIGKINISNRPLKRTRNDSIIFKTKIRQSKDQVKCLKGGLAVISKNNFIRVDEDMIKLLEHSSLFLLFFRLPFCVEALFI